MADESVMTCIRESSDDSDGSVFNGNRKRKPALILEDDDDSQNVAQISETSLSNDEKENKDEIGIIAFSEQSARVEENLKRLKKQFPTLDEINLQDILLSCGNKYLTACWRIRRDFRSRRNWKENNTNTWLSTGTGTTSRVTESSYFNNNINALNHTSKNVNKFPSRRVVSSDNSSGDDVEVVYKNSDSTYKAKSAPRRKKLKIDDDSDDMNSFIVSSGEDEEEEEIEPEEDLLALSDYENDEIVSESDSESENDVKFVNEAKKVPRKRLTYRSKILELLNNGLDCDLLTIPSVSQKKVQLLKELRPISDWDDLMFKLENHRTLSKNILANVMQTVKSQDVVCKLMQESEQMSQKIEAEISPLTTIKQPKILNRNCKLTDYQLYGVSWLAMLHEKKINAILADEMGLGKTIQVIALLAHLYERGVNGPHLIVVPASTLENWVREFETWCPKLSLLLYYGSLEERAAIRAEIYSKRSEKFDVIVTTYNMLNNSEDKKLFRRTKFTYVVFDEAHMLKNMKSMRYNNLLEVKGSHRLLLTGTPLQNDLLELMSLLVFTMPSLFYEEIKHIKSLFACSKQASQTAFEKERVMQAKKILKPFILRRLKIEVLKDLPKKSEFIEMCPMTHKQEEYYMQLIEKYSRQISYSKKGASSSGFSAKYGTFKGGQGMIMQLRQAANHPLLLRIHYTDSILRQMAELMLNEPTHVDANVDYIFEDMQVCSDFELHKLCLHYRSLNKFKLATEEILESGKFKVLDKLLPGIIETGKRILLFSQFVIVLDIIAEYLNIRNYKYLRLDGSTKVPERLSLIDQYSDDSSIPIFLLSTKAGGLGINLTAAQVVIIHDIDFNPYNDKQAEDRCHRVGQTKDVFVYRLISENSVEEGMLHIGEEKLKLGQEICADDEKAASEQEEKDIKKLLRQALHM